MLKNGQPVAEQFSLRSLLIAVTVLAIGLAVTRLLPRDYWFAALMILIAGSGFFVAWRDADC